MRKSFLIVLAYLLLLQFVMPVLVLIPCALYQLLVVGQIDHDGLMRQVLIPSHVLTGLCTIVWFVSQARRTACLQKLRFLPAWQAVCGAMVAMASLVVLLDPLLAWLDLPDTSRQTFQVLLADWAGFLAVTVTGAIAEELVFRRAVMDALSVRYSAPVCILVSSVLFAVIHVNPAQVVPAFLLGILLAWIYSRTHSIALCCLLHMANNLVSASFILAGHTSVELLPETLPVYVCVLAYCMVIFLLIAGIRVIIRYTRPTVG